MPVRVLDGLSMVLCMRTASAVAAIALVTWLIYADDVLRFSESTRSSALF
jgi:hypothetical protein